MRQSGCVGCRATFNSGAILILLTRMSNDFVTQSSARRCRRLILNGSGAWRKFCQSEILGDEQDGELKRAGCALSTLQGEGWDQIQGNTASFAFDHPLSCHCSVNYCIGEDTVVALDWRRRDQSDGNTRQTANPILVRLSFFLISARVC